MSLLGRANWWLPGWLDRILPHIDLEGGHSVATPVATGATPDPDSEREPELAIA